MEKSFQKLDLDLAITNVPGSMRDVRQWVVWKLEPDGKGKPTKVPYNPRVGSGSSTDPSTWGTFREAITAYRAGGFQGIGFVFANGFVGVDLDACRDPVTGQIEQWALDIIRALESYSEVSPSLTGLHVFGKGRVPHAEEKGLNRVVCGHKIEVYSKGRFFTFTGDVLSGVPSEAEERQSEITQLYQWIVETCEAQNRAKRRAGISDDEDKVETGERLALVDDEILSLLSFAANSAKFKRLWSGDCATDYPMDGRPEGDHSAADLGFCSMVAFYTDDAEQIDRIFRKSQLYRDKWERPDYRSATIAKAISGTGQRFEAKQQGAQFSGDHIRVTKKEFYALKDWSKLTDLEKLILLGWRWDEEDIATFEALASVWGGRKKLVFRAAGLTIGKRLRGLPDDAEIADRQALERFARRRVKKLLATIEATVSLPIIKINKPGGMVNGKNIPKEYKINFTPFIEAARLAEQICNQRVFDGLTIKSPGQAREIAARTVSKTYALVNADEELKAEREAKRERKAKLEQEANDLGARQIKFEKRLKAEAEKLWSEMFADDLSRIDIKIYFDSLGEYLKELGRRNLSKKGVIVTRSKSFVSDGEDDLNITVDDDLGADFEGGRGAMRDPPKTDAETLEADSNSNSIVYTNADIANSLPFDSVRLGPAIWRNADHDEHVSLTRDMGIGPDGRRYVRIEGSETAIPFDEVFYPPSQVEVTPEMIADAYDVLAETMREAAELESAPIVDDLSEDFFESAVRF